ncbi:hypothetical protein TNCV_3343271 [Trichonephila clavipes]|nr:hypothetical protein TNCV_3343271 [Trichonephila clavipes]
MRWSPNHKSSHVLANSITRIDSKLLPHPRLSFLSLEPIQRQADASNRSRRLLRRLPLTKHSRLFRLELSDFRNLESGRLRGM